MIPPVQGSDDSRGPLGSSRSTGVLNALTAMWDWGNRAAWAAAAVSTLLFLYSIIYTSPNGRFIIVQQEWDVIERETDGFCEKHGMPFGSREHTACAEDLRDIRASERQRTADSSGIF